MAKTNGMFGDFSFYPPKWAASLDLVTPLWILWFSCIFCVCVLCIVYKCEELCSPQTNGLDNELYVKWVRVGPTLQLDSYALSEVIEATRGRPNLNLTDPIGSKSKFGQDVFRFRLGQAWKPEYNFSLGWVGLGWTLAIIVRVEKNYPNLLING